MLNISIFIVVLFSSFKAQFWLAQACENGRKLEVNAMLEVPGIDINISNVVSY